MTANSPAATRLGKNWPRSAATPLFRSGLVAEPPAMPFVLVYFALPGEAFVGPTEPEQSQC